MADIYCNKCSEPWDWFYIRDDVLGNEALYQKMKRQGGYIQDTPHTGNGFDSSFDEPVEVEDKYPTLHPKEANWQFGPGPVVEQCPCCYGKIVDQSDDAKIRAELAHLYGDDIDGFIADMEDFGLTE